MNGPRLVVFDTASLYFRAFFGLPGTLRALDGRPVNAVRGLLDFIARLTTQYSPTHLACAWDEDWRPAWRVDLVPTYKAHRVAQGDEEVVPDDLSAQVPLILDVLDALGIPVIGATGFEADDVLGTLAERFPGEVFVVTGDRDLFQVADDRVKVLYVGRGVARHEVVDADWVLARYGIPADRYVDFAVLRGDPSDGLPGVPGIGEKSAAQLIVRYGDIDGIVAAASDPSSGMAPGLRSKVAAAVGYLGAAREVVRVASDLDVPLPHPIEGGRVDRARFDALTTELQLGGPAVRVLAALGVR